MATGDHIKVKRLWGLYYHHGIDIGNKIVVHFTGEPLNKLSKKFAIIRQTSLNEFARNQSIEVVDYSTQRINRAKQTVKMALAEVGKRGYSILQNNCEHFAVYCKTGIKHSEQIEGLINAMSRDTQVIRGGLSKSRWQP